LDIVLERAWISREDWEKMGHAAFRRASLLIPENPESVFSDILLSEARH
jgi:hypothetical protein